MKPKRKRMLLVGGAMLVVAAGAALVLTALEDNIVFFHSPSDVIARKVEHGRRFRIGGLVAEGSVKKGEAQQVTFDVTDGKATVRVAYKGSLPDLFREGQGVVAQGALRPDGVFAASEVLAKHDENYMPPEVAAALKKSGRWQHYKDGKPISPTTGAPPAGAPAAGKAQ